VKLHGAPLVQSALPAWHAHCGVTPQVGIIPGVQLDSSNGTQR
jgi:hypothetical protein